MRGAAVIYRGAVPLLGTAAEPGRIGVDAQPVDEVPGEARMRFDVPLTAATRAVTLDHAVLFDGERYELDRRLVVGRTLQLSGVRRQ